MTMMPLSSDVVAVLGSAGAGPGRSSGSGSGGGSARAAAVLGAEVDDRARSVVYV